MDIVLREASGCRLLITMSKLKVACSKRDGSKPVIERKKMVKFILILQHKTARTTTIVSSLFALIVTKDYNFTFAKKVTTGTSNPK